MSEQYFNNEEVETMLESLGLVNLKHVASISQLNKLFGLAIKTIAKEPAAVVSQNYKYQNYTSIKTDKLDITNTKNSKLEDGDKLYLLKAKG